MIILALVPVLTGIGEKRGTETRDKAAVLIEDGAVISAVDSDRLFKVKNPETLFPSVGYVLDDSGITFQKVDKIAVLGLDDTGDDNPGRQGIREQLKKRMQEEFNVEINNRELFYIDPHYAFAVNSFTLSGYDNCMVLSLDKTGEQDSIMVLSGSRNSLRTLDSFPCPGPANQEPHEREVINSLINHQNQTGNRELCITGNRMLSSTLEEKIRAAGIFEDIFHQPVEHAGAWAVGAGLYLFFKETLTGETVKLQYEIYRNDTEKILTHLWEEILSREKIGINDDFFELGGNSLKALELENRVNKELNIQLPLPEIYRLPTIKELSLYIRQAEKIAHSAIKKVELKEYYPLSSAQKRLFIIDEMETGPKSTNYNLPAIFNVEGVIRKKRLEEVLEKIIDRHESLRTVFKRINGEPVQQIIPQTGFREEYYRQETGGNEWEQQVKEVIKRFVRPFDLDRELLRVGLIEIKENRQVLMVDMHHIIADGISQDILIKEFIALYAGEAPPQLGLQFKDYVEWQNSSEVVKQRQEQEDYWLKEIGGDIPVLGLPTDYPRPPVQDFAGSQVTFEIDKETTGRLRVLAKEENVTLFMLLLAVFNILLARLSLQEDIIIGTDISGRRHADLDRVIGMFVNTLALRNYPAEKQTFTGFLAEVKERTFQAFANQDYLLEDLVDKVIETGEPSRNPLFDVMFSYQGIDAYADKIPYTPGCGFKLTGFEYVTTSAKFDLLFTVYERGEKFFALMEYRTKLFKKEKIEKFTVFFKEVIFVVLENKNIRLQDIELTSRLIEAEPGQVSMDFGF